MGLREFSKRLLGPKRTIGDQAEQVDPLAFLSRVPGRVPIDSVVPRHRVTVAGFVLALQKSAENEPPWLTAILQDDSGAMEIVWQGRREVPGVEVGTPLIAHGTVLVAKKVLRIIDPAYTIVGEDAL